MSSEAHLDNLCVVLVSTRNPLNIGAAARAMSNFGFSCLRVVRPYDVAFREAKSAVGAAELLKSAREYDSVADAVSDCSLVVGTTAVRDRELQHPLRDLHEGATILRRKLQRGPVAILFGSEKRGLSNDDFSHCDWLIRIPTEPKQPSMNLGQAVAVCLYEIARLGVKQLQVKNLPVASGSDRERLAATLLETLRASEYSQSGKEELKKVRRLVHRLSLSSDDSRLLLGMLRQMLWKMRSRD